MSNEAAAWGLIDQGRAAEALAITTPLVAARASSSALMAHAAALKALGRHAEALPFNRRAVEQSPNDRIAWYNLAATLGDLASPQEAEEAGRRAISLGLDAPEVWLVLARALQLQNRFEDAEAAFREAVARRPNYADALRDLAQLIWMRTADLSAALQPVDAAIASNPADPNLHHLRAVVQQFAGEPKAALESLARGLALAPADIRLLIAASHIAAELRDADAALTFARRASDAAPGARAVEEALCLANLAVGDAAAAGEGAARLRAADPFNQFAIAMQATAWRLTDDPRAHELYDYAAFVRPYRIETPEGWPDLAAFLADLKRSLDALHQLDTHPLQQSLRHGTQVQSLHLSPDPAIQAFFRSVDRALTRYMADVGHGDDPLRARNTGAARVHSAWSVRLRPSGFHVDHFHPEGWLSSAFYVETPDTALDTSDRQGWIKFGQPGVPTRPVLGPEHFVRPEPGLLVLFPSYMWHGTVPFISEESRMTIAFDVVPA
ncbi:MAG: putative 2OG-Fe(II) oxygenase [Ignavibacteriales bacterium]